MLVSSYLNLVFQVEFQRQSAIDDKEQNMIDKEQNTIDMLNKRESE